MQAKQLKKYIIEPTLKYFSEISNHYKKIYTPEAVKLLLMTAAVESNMGRYIIQNNDKMEEGKKALGIYQLEPATINYIYQCRKSELNTFLKEWRDSLPYNPNKNFRELFGSHSLLNTMYLCAKGKIDINTRILLISDLRFSTILARLVYWYKTKDPIPNVNDNEALWKYYKKWYNSTKGDTIREEFFRACKRHKVL